MNIGEKIKNLRNKKLMTQSELAGNVITRNMLSSIENGTALPSLATLRHISAKLNVPAGYLLAEGDDEMIYLKLSEIANIKNAYLSKNFRICRDMCVNTEMERDDEINLIFAECSLALGIESFNEGRLHSAGEYFDEAIEISSNTIYATQHISALAAVYFRYMRRVSATLSSDMIDEGDADIYAALSDEFALYTIALEALEAEDIGLTEFFLPKIEKNAPYALHIGARCDMKNGNYEEAYQKLYKILINPYKIQDPMMYFVFCDLEICCKEIKDFKGAYEYSNDKIAILQRLLTNND